MHGDKYAGSWGWPAVDLMVASWSDAMMNWRMRWLVSVPLLCFVVLLLPIGHFFQSASVVLLFLCVVLFCRLSHLMSSVTAALFPPRHHCPLCLAQTAQGGGHRTLLYGHAVLLRHSYSGMVSEHTYRFFTSILGHCSMWTPLDTSLITRGELEVLKCRWSDSFIVFACSVPVLSVHIPLIHRQIGFWCGTAGRYHR